MYFCAGFEKKLGAITKTISGSADFDGYDSEEVTKNEDGRRFEAIGERYRVNRKTSVHLRLRRQLRRRASIT